MEIFLSLKNNFNYFFLLEILQGWGDHRQLVGNTENFSI